MFSHFMERNCNDRILENWRKFQQGLVVEDVRPVILDSWRRCRALGVDVNSQRNDYLASEEREMLLEEERELIEVASPIMERLQESLASYTWLLNLANAGGICLKTWRGLGEITLVAPGEKISERTAGTAGMPLCLFLRQPVIIYGAEHYCRRHHNLVCVASPLLNARGAMLGGISISMDIEIFHPWSVTFIQEAANSITEQLRLREALDTSETLIENFSEGIIVINQAGQVTRINRRAMTMLGLEAQEGSGRLDELIAGSCLKKIAAAQSVNNEEVRIITARGMGAGCLVNFNPSENGGVLSIEKASKIYGYATRTAGVNANFHFNDILGQSEAIDHVIAAARKYAMTDGSVLITGESGTGKELFAHAIHNASSRRTKPFVVVNCGALPRDLVQSELFGYEEGAFTGARRHGNPGKFELADGGTIFLDEIGEMSLEAQTSLLRLLQSGEVTRLGSRSSRKVNARVLAATNRDLREAMRTGQFREDLFHRLNVLPLRVPPLRERPEDIPVLAMAALKRMACAYPNLKSRVFSVETLEELKKRPWPGNVRELEHAVERVAFMSQNNVIQKDELERCGLPDGRTAVLEEADPRKDEKALLERLLAEYNGNARAVASRLGVGKTTLYSKLNIYGITPRSFRSSLRRFR